MRRCNILTVCILLTLVVVSCGTGTPVTEPDITADLYPVTTQYSGITQQSSNEISWGYWEGTISADRTEVTMIPKRGVDTYGTFNVLWWLEQSPCTDCLQIVGKEFVGPNRMDLAIELSHPFYGHPKWTGFDVVGGLWFESSKKLAYPNIFNFHQYVISWRYDNESQLLNPDGFDNRYCMSEKPDKWKGFIPGKFGGEILDEFGYPIILWGFKLFQTTEVRNIFETTGSDTQTYELWLPEGQEIKFGYNVLARWVLPDNEPVTDPAADFPVNANRLIYRFEVVEISGPATSTEDAIVRFRIYYHPIHEFDPDGEIEFYEYDQMDYIGAGGVLWKDLELVSEDQISGVNEYLLTLERWPDGPDKGQPGMYPYLIMVGMDTDISGTYKGGMFIVEIEALD